MGQILHVPSNYSTIGAAIAVARNGDQVAIADGTYTGSGNHNLDTLGKAIAIRSENGPTNCIIDCQGQDSTNLFRIATQEGPGTVIDGLTFKDTYYSSAYESGAITCYGTSPTIRNCCFTWTAA